MVVIVDPVPLEVGMWVTDVPIIVCTFFLLLIYI